MPIEFENDAQRATYETVAATLREEFGKQAYPTTDQPAFLLARGSAFVTVSVSARGDTSSILRVYSWVVTEPESAPDLYRYLLELNLGFNLGAFGIDQQGDVAFTYALPGEGLTADQILFAVHAVSSTADQFDDEIVSKFGGRRAVDRK